MGNKETKLDEVMPDEPVQESTAVDAMAEEIAQKEAEMEAGTEASDEPQGPGEIFEFADVHFSCSVCGNKTKMAEGMRGVSFTVPAAENAEVKLECTECGACLKLYFVDSSDEVKEAKRAEIEELQKQQEAEHGADIQEDTEEGPGQGSSDDTERSTEVDEEADNDSASVDGDGQAVEA